MGRLDRYIGGTVLGAMALVLLVLGGLDLLFSGIDQIGETDDRYTLGAALIYVLYGFPRHLYEMLPLTALIGALAGLGALAASNELVAMQAAGVSRLRIVLAVMKPSVLVMLLGLVLGEYVAPPLEVRGEVHKALASGSEVALSRYGHWERNDNAFLHFNAIEPEGILYGVSMFEFDEQQRMIRRLGAERAVYRSGGGWQLEQGTETLFDHGGDVVASTHTPFASRPLDLDLTPELLQVLLIDPGKMAISDLYRYAQRFERQGQEADDYYLSFWKKLLQPLTTGVLVLLAISFIFGPLREATMGSRVFTAICFGLAFTIVQRLMHSVSLVYDFDPLLSVLLPILLCAALGIALLRRSA